MTVIRESDMPAPRLELRWHKVGKTCNTRVCCYNLVLPLGPNDVRRQGDPDLSNQLTQTFELSRTESLGLQPPYRINGDEDDCILTPLQDGAHAKWDSAHLGYLPVFAVCHGRAQRIDENGGSSL